MRNDFAVFIMVHGRPDKMWTYKSLRRCGYTGKIFLVADNLDETLPDYKKKYGDELIVFDKNDASLSVDAGDNSGDMRSTLFAVNEIPGLAESKGIRFYFMMCDDYTSFHYKFNERLEYCERPIKQLDKIFDLMISLYEKTGALTVAMAQNGDFIGGKDNTRFARKFRLHRKAMNTFLCSTERPMKFFGRLNEDVTTYVLSGSTGNLILTLPMISINQKPSQGTSGGLTEVYLDFGTYVKSFFSVMFNPSSIDISKMGQAHRRYHHRVFWNKAVPKIVKENKTLQPDQISTAGVI